VPPAGLAVDVDVAARLLHEAEHHAEAEPGALARLLGGEERLEHAGEHLRRHADATVADLDHHIGTGRHLDMFGGIILVEVTHTGGD
jgi:hypothetical protein